MKTMVSACLTGENCKYNGGNNRNETILQLMEDNEEITDILFSSRKSVDLDYLQPDCEKILEKQRKGYFRNELWTEYCAEAGAKGKKAYKLSRFNEIVSDYRGKHDISFMMNHVPGLEGIVEMNRAQTFNVCALKFLYIPVKSICCRRHNPEQLRSIERPWSLLQDSSGRNY